MAERRVQDIGRPNQVDLDHLPEFVEGLLAKALVLRNPGIRDYCVDAPVVIERTFEQVTPGIVTFYGAVFCNRPAPTADDLLDS